MSLVRRIRKGLRRRFLAGASRPWNAGWQIFSVAVVRGADPFSLEIPRRPDLHPRHITDRAALLVADPFIVRDADRWWMFVEVATDRGEIGLASSTDGHDWKYEGIVLSEPFHLSYPQVFQAGSDWYMVPEPQEAKAVRLYRAVDFPRTWTLDRELISGEPLSDATLLERDGTWWMWAEETRFKFDTVRLFSAPDLHGPWSEHPASRVVEGDPARARPAGRMIEYDGRLFRPVQDCEHAYGHRVRMMEVTTLDHTSYEEHECLQHPYLEGSGRRWNADGMHHVDALEASPGVWVAAIDGWVE